MSWWQNIKKYIITCKVLFLASAIVYKFFFLLLKKNDWVLFWVNMILMIEKRTLNFNNFQMTFGEKNFDAVVFLWGLFYVIKIHCTPYFDWYKNNINLPSKRCCCPLHWITSTNRKNAHFTIKWHSKASSLT